jgi:hypothetical protein
MTKVARALEVNAEEMAKYDYQMRLILENIFDKK